MFWPRRSSSASFVADEDLCGWNILLLTFFLLHELLRYRREKLFSVCILSLLHTSDVHKCQGRVKLCKHTSMNCTQVDRSFFLLLVCTWDDVLMEMIWPHFTHDACKIMAKSKCHLSSSMVQSMYWWITTMFTTWQPLSGLLVSCAISVVVTPCFSSFLTGHGWLYFPAFVVIILILLYLVLFS